MPEKFTWPPQSRMEVVPLDGGGESPLSREGPLFFPVAEDNPSPAKWRPYPVGRIAAGLALVGVVSVTSYLAFGATRPSASVPEPAAPVATVGRDIPLSPDNNGTQAAAPAAPETRTQPATRRLTVARQAAVPSPVRPAMAGPGPALAAAFAAPGRVAGIEAVEAEAPAPAPAGPVDGDTYSTADVGVIPPKLLSRGFVAPRAEGLGLSSTSSIELWISETGNVERVRLLAPSRTMSDAMLLSRAKQFTFAPAIRGDTPVPYRIVLSVEVGP